ncbi:MAG: Hsp70 family protein [Armatimonadetes bacterium]|nr:Hsp70 family protein [Armatimonadota bacterium]
MAGADSSPRPGESSPEQREESLVNEPVIGIDLGTTNSEVAVFLSDRVEILEVKGHKLLPSCVGLAPDGELLIGREACNQHALYPERTVRSIKRKMGNNETLTLGDRTCRGPKLR